MTHNKTQAELSSVDDFLNSLTNDELRSDAQKLRTLFEHATGVSAVMWGTSIVGFGSYHYVYESGREGDSLVVGFAPRTDKLAIYGIASQTDQSKLYVGKPPKQGKGCLYIKRLSDVREEELTAIVQRAFKAGHK